MPYCRSHATQWPGPALMLRCGSHHRCAAGFKTFRLLVLGPAIFQSKQLPRTFCITSEAAAGSRQTSTPVSPPATRETMAPAMSASSVRAGCGLRAAGDRRCYSVPCSGERPMRRKLASVSALWLFLLSSLARRNGLLSFRFLQRRIVTRNAPADRRSGSVGSMGKIRP